MPTIEIRYMGLIEVGSHVRRGPRRDPRPSYRWVDGYSVVLNGVETQPWLPRRGALKLARKIQEEQQIEEARHEQG